VCRIELTAAAVVRDLDQLYRLVLLQAFSDGAVGTSDVMPLTINFRNNACLLVNVARTKTANCFGSLLQAPLAEDEESRNEH
jgi:hypothetical protein